MEFLFRLVCVAILVSVLVFLAFILIWVMSTIEALYGTIWSIVAFGAIVVVILTLLSYTEV